MVFAAGCARDDGLSRVVISGAVTYDGKPVEKGQIRFVPSPGTSGPATIDPIDGGRYTTENTGGAISGIRFHTIGSGRLIECNRPAASTWDWPWATSKSYH